MGRRGPAPTPTAILRARGSWRGKVREGEPQATGEPQCPGWIKGEARKAWGELLPTLTAMGVVGQADEGAVARYCQLWAWWQECRKFIDEHGMVAAHRSEDGRVQLTEFPQVNRASRLAEQLLRLEQQFGLTPAARAGLRVQVEDGNGKDAKDRFFAPKLVG